MALDKIILIVDPLVGFCDPEGTLAQVHGVQELEPIREAQVGNLKSDVLADSYIRQVGNLKSDVLADSYIRWGSILRIESLNCVSSSFF